MSTDVNTTPCAPSLTSILSPLLVTHASSITGLIHTLKKAGFQAGFKSWDFLCLYRQKISLTEEGATSC